MPIHNDEFEYHSLSKPKLHIAWVSTGYSHWIRYNYETLEAALAHNSYGSEMVVTKLVQYDVVEKE